METPKRELYKNPVNCKEGFKVQEPYAFNDRGQMSKIINSEAYHFFCILKNGLHLSRNEKDQLLKLIYQNTGNTDFMLMGMIIPFKQFLEPYLVEFNDGSLKRVYGFDRTSVRNTYHYIKNVWRFPTR